MSAVFLAGTAAVPGPVSGGMKETRPASEKYTCLQHGTELISGIET